MRFDFVDEVHVKPFSVVLCYGLTAADEPLRVATHEAERWLAGLKGTPVDCLTVHAILPASSLAVGMSSPAILILGHATATKLGADFDEDLIAGALGRLAQTMGSAINAIRIECMVDGKIFTYRRAL